MQGNNVTMSQTYTISHGINEASIYNITQIPHVLIRLEESKG